jgi:putative hemolysin
MDSVDSIYIILFVICIAGSAFFSMAEIVLFSLQKVKLEHMLETGRHGATTVAALIKQPERLLSTILLGNNFFNIAAASLGTLIAANFWEENVAAAISTIVVTIVILVFGEAIPKTSGARNAETLSLIVAKPVLIISKLLGPAVFILSGITRIFGKVTGGAVTHGSLVSEEEIRTMINVGSREGTFEKEEAELLHNVFDFGDRPAVEVMIPRTEVVWIEKGTTLKEFLKIYTEQPMNRYPVFEETWDNVAGVISAQDVLLVLAKGNCNLSQTIDELIRPTYFVPESKPVNELLPEMRDNQVHMSIVVDEYGGTSGIITITNLVEEIVGDLRDELTIAAQDYQKINDYTYKIDAGLRIDEANEIMGLDISEGDYETVAGFVLQEMGKIPKKGEYFKYKDLKFVILKMNNFKIEEILVTRDRDAKIEDKVQPQRRD